MSSSQLNSKTNGLVLSIKTISRRRNCFLSSVATDGKDRNGLKLEKIEPIFHVLMLSLPKSPKTLLWLALRDEIHLISS